MDEKYLKLIGWCLGLLISVCLIFSGIGRLSKSKSFENKAVEVQATVSQVSKHVSTHSDSGKYYDIYVNYEYNGVKYQNIHLTSQGMLCQVGDTETVLIDPDNPFVCATGNSLSPASYALIMGGIFLGIIMVIKIFGEVGEIRGK